MADQEGTVEHQQHRSRFVLALEGEEAELTYQQHGVTMRIDHTGVPPVLQHRGLANRLAEAALLYAREQHLQIKPRCRFMATYLERHPEYGDLVSKS